MNKGIKSLILLLALCVGIPTIAFANYIISSNDITSFDNVTKIDNNKTIFKVTFKNTDGSILKEEYLEKGKKLDSTNIPYINSSRVVWNGKDNNNLNIKLDLCDKTCNTYMPTSDITLTASIISAQNSFKVNDNVINKNTSNNENNPNGNTTTIINGNSINLIQNHSGITNNSKTCNQIEIGGAFDNVSLTSSYYGKDIEKNVLLEKVVDKDITETNLHHHENQANNDNYLALEDSTVVSSDNYHFKEAGPNYCVSRIILNSDLILTNTTFTIGGMVSFWGNNSDYSQRNMQGFITGNYSEIDLNGHNLILGNKGTLISQGSITNSHPESGKIIIQNGGLLKTQFVYEDQNFEKNLPIQYYIGGSIFKSYRMPYLNCTTRIETGGNLVGQLKIDFGGGNDNYLIQDLSLFGKTNASAFSFTDGYVEREVNFDQNIINLNNNFLNKNIMAQEISYHFYNCSNIVTNHIKINAKVVTTFSLSLFKNGLLLPSYFQIYLHNSNVRLYYNLTFLPGSYLFVDETSKITFCSTALDKNHIDEFPNIVGISLGLDNYCYQTVGGLNFAIEQGDFVEACRSSGVIGWIDNVHDSPTNGNNGDSQRIHRDGDPLISYCNKNKIAHCDMNGSFAFENINNFTNYSLKYQLGGYINIKNVESFKNTLNSRNDVILFGSSQSIGPSNSVSGGKSPSVFGNMQSHVTDFYYAPLISNGLVLMDFQNQGHIREDYLLNPATYNKINGLVSYANKYYAFMHTNSNLSTWNGDMTHFNKTRLGLKPKNDFNNAVNNYKNSTGSEFGKYFEVTVNSNHSIHCASVTANNKNDYIFFRGAFAPFDGTNVYIDKLRTADSNLKNKGTVRPVKYVSNVSHFGHDAWRLV